MFWQLESSSKINANYCFNDDLYIINLDSVNHQLYAMNNKFKVECNKTSQIAHLETLAYKLNATFF